MLGPIIISSTGEMVPIWVPIVGTVLGILLPLILWLLAG